MIEYNVQLCAEIFENLSEIELSTNIYITDINSGKNRTPEWINK